MKTAVRNILLFGLLALAPAVAAGAAGSDAQHEEITIAAVGDIMLGGRAEPYLLRHGPDYPFRDVLPVLREADLIVGNLECPISTRGTAVKNKTFTLRVGPVGARALAAAGIRVVTLANNHTMDFGPLALRDTLAALTEAGIVYAGAGMDLSDARTPAVATVKGRTVAVLSYSLTFPLDFFASARRPGTAPGYADFVKADIEKVRPRADLVVVCFHWGAELMTAAKDYQVALGRSAVDWGADLVIGHHPHVLQEIELYKGRLIAYSLGNFVFGSQSNRTNTSVILLATFRGNDLALATAQAVPIDVNNYRVEHQPRILRGEAGAAVFNDINRASARFKTKLDVRDGRGVMLLETRPGGSAGISPGTP